MLRSRSFLTPLCLLAAVFALTGCSGSDAPEPEGAAADASSDEWKLGGDAKSKKTESPKEAAVDRSRTSLEGRWQLMMIQQIPAKDQFVMIEAPFCIVDLKPEGEPEVEAVAFIVPPQGQQPVKFTLKEGTIDGNTVKLTVLVEDKQEISFQGEFSDGVVRGNAVAPGPLVVPARLIATKASSLKNAKPSEAPNLQELQAALSAKDVAKGARQFIDKNPESPLVLEAWQVVIGTANVEKLPLDEVSKSADSLVAAAGTWGERLQQEKRILAALLLTRGGYAPEVALRLLDEAEKARPKDNETMEKTIASIREAATIVKTMLERQARLDEAKKQLASKDADEQEKGRAALAELAQEDPLNPLVIYEQARDAESQEKTDEAIDLYARLAAWPGVTNQLKDTWSRNEEKHPEPAAALEKLWKTKHGGRDGLEARLDEEYRKLITSLAGEKVPAREGEDGERTTLIELFTGAQCAPCVAADLAVSAVEATFDPSDVIALRYHLHSAGPDQLANDDTERRFYSDIRQGEQAGTPTVYVDGKTVTPVGGFTPSDAERAYKLIREQVAKALEEKPEVTLKVSAEAKDGQIEFSAEAEGLPEKAEGLKLRLVLAEEEIPFVAPNGVRLHEMVVRTMPGPSRGVPVIDGKLSYKGTLKLDEFKRKLSEYLDGYEEGNLNVDFKVKPLALEKLRFVAMVQREQDRHVLQAAAVPVTGTIEYTKPKAPRAPAGE